MDMNLDNIVNGVLEEIARRYNTAKEDWKAERRNPFKDGRFLAYYEIKEAALKCMEGGGLPELMDVLSRRYNAVKEDWKADRRNPFKDGRFLAYFEVLRIMPPAAAIEA